MKQAIRPFVLKATVSSIIAIQSFSPGATAPAAPFNAPAASAPASRPGATVKIDNFKFNPPTLEIAVGATVTWQNSDDVPHTVTSRELPLLLDSSALDTDDKFSFRFSKPGKYTYFCKVHPHMTGVVIVK